MAYFAKLNNLNIVTEVVFVNNNVLTINGIEQEQAGIDFLKNLFNEPNSIWKKTSYNTNGNVYYNTDAISGEITLSSNQNKAFRKNYAGIGYYYDQTKDAFIPPKPFNSWILNETTCLWEAPIPMPTFDEGTKIADWDENNKQWIIKEIID